MSDDIRINNEKIARFMGWSSDDNHYWLTSPVGYKAQISTFHYHDDWRELMSVVEKIESDGKGYVQMVRNFCQIWNDGVAITSPYLEESKIKAVYAAVCEHIDWYNEQNKG